jgi:hypothetical protein
VDGREAGLAAVVAAREEPDAQPARNSMVAAMMSEW